MKRLFAASVIAAAALAVAAPAHADLGGYCDGKVDVACREHPCVEDYPCEITFCLVWTGSHCGL